MQCFLILEFDGEKYTVIEETEIEIFRMTIFLGDMKFLYSFLRAPRVIESPFGSWNGPSVVLYFSFDTLTGLESMAGSVPGKVNRCVR